MRYFIQIQFKGTNYHGWQIQPNAISVQEKLNYALSTFFNYNIETLGCGRTDAGVHATKFFVHFNTREPIVEFDKCKKAINYLLPVDICVDDIFEVADDAHVRFDASSRTYHYFMHNNKNPFLIDLSCKIYQNLNISLMNEAASKLLIYNDFSCFSKSKTQVLTNLCTVTKASFHVIDTNRFYFEITANRFLRNMVRAIVGTLMLVGESKISVQQFEEIILGKDRKKAGKSVDACGLFLVDIEYPYLVQK